MSPDDDERSWRDEDRPSWREIDKMRGQSRHRREDKPAFEGGKKQQAWARQAALRQADKMFKRKKDPAQLKAEQALEEAKGTPAFADEAKKFVETYSFTDDWHVQLLLAEVPVSQIAVPAIEALKESAAELDKTEKRAVTSQLRILAMTGKSKIKMAAKAALNEIK